MFGMNSGLGSIFSGLTFLWVIALVVVVWVFLRGRRNTYVSGTTLVLRKFHIDESPTARAIVEIDGRASGVVSWLLTLLKLKPDMGFVLTDSEIIIRSASLSGTQITYVPIDKITASVCGYQRSILAFCFAAFFTFGFVIDLLSGLSDSLGNRNAVGSDMGLAFGYLILAGISAGVYYLSKKISIVVESMHKHGVVFKRSVIENVTVDLPEAMRVISLINNRILAAQTIKTFAVAPSASPAPPPVTPVLHGNGNSGRCPRCSTTNPVGAQFCENCGAGLSAWV